MTLTFGPPPIGDIIPDKYKVVRDLGFGRTGRVFHVKNRRTGEDVAVKLTHALDGGHSPRKESTLQTMCSHNNVVKIYDAYERGGAFIIEMEYMAQGSLSDALAKKFVPVPDSIAYIRQALSGLNWVHRNGILHRDMTAENIMLSGEIAKLSDFGAAQESASRDIVSDFLYEPYLAPETHDSGVFSTASDVFGVGITLLRAVNNLYSFHTKLTEARQRLQPDTNIADLIGFGQFVPPRLRRIIRKAVSFDASERYMSAADFKEDLDRLKPVRWWRRVSEAAWACNYHGLEEVIRLYPGTYPCTLHSVGGRQRARRHHKDMAEAKDHLLAIVANTTLQ
ncbi:serine/threonine-protein kinase [Roseixanthobacter glucoisosaccharinicivorans]|uniref:serine/threonine-protein kinase n=1 Tax=Roseixanthobacter glucoisosaccharinicivorans TaxID=3119923 RepID=UPI0037292DA6